MRIPTLFIQLLLFCFGQTGIIATNQSFEGAASVAVDGMDGFYFSSGNRIYHISADGRSRLVAGDGIRGYEGDGGKATSARLFGPKGLAMDSNGNLYIADSENHRVRKITVAGMISTVAGNGSPGYSGDGGKATSAKLNHPWGIAIDSTGNLFIADSGNNCVRKVTPAGIIVTIAGNGTLGYSGDGSQAISAHLAGPHGVALDSAGNLLIADSRNNRIRKVTPSGIISTVAGSGAIIYGAGGS